jgi:hypothetical protein
MQNKSLAHEAQINARVPVPILQTTSHPDVKRRSDRIPNAQVVEARLVREDPPEVDRTRRRDRPLTEWNALLKKAIANKGKWYRVSPDYDTSSQASTTAYDIRNGRNGAIPPGRWDAVARDVTLYVRYLGS